MLGPLLWPLSCWVSPHQLSWPGRGSERAGLSLDRKGVAEIRGFLRKHNRDPQTLTRRVRGHAMVMP